VIPSVQAATFGQRAIARLIDLVVLLLLLAGAFAGFASKDGDGTTSFDVQWWYVALVFIGIVTYEVVPVHVRGQTPGKILTRIRIVSLETGATPTWVQSITRWIIPVAILLGLTPFVSFVVFPLLAVVYGTALLDRGGRNVLDKLAGTRVVQATPT
jgi:uncharacterized RDD family membrane protein YckC